jgi:hypothetical protein
MLTKLWDVPMIRSRRNDCSSTPSDALAESMRGVSKRRNGSARSGAFRSGDTVHVYEFGGPKTPRYLGKALTLGISDPTRSTYQVRFDRDSSVRVAVVASSLQLDPETALRELSAQWA